MKFLCGLGNPGEKYQKTRHNIGFMALDQLQQDLEVQTGQSAEKKSAFSSEVLKFSQLLLFKPQTFMNDSGRAARAAVDYYQKDFSSGQPLDNFYVLFDDLDLEIGKYKVQFGKGPKVHNGLLSLYQHLGTDQFWHVRLGVDGRQGSRTIAGQDYVLAAFTDLEQPLIREMLKTMSQDLRQRLKE
jgi:PTH1 family peptidyl-tRNA hydrolase